MKKILIANDRLTGGGVENVLENLVRYLLRQGCDVILKIPNCTYKEVCEVFGDSVKLYPQMRSLKNVEKYSISWFWDRVLYILQSEIYKIHFSLQQFDVLIALKEGNTMQELARLYAKKKYAWIHVDYHFMHWTKWCFSSNEDERKCMRQYDKVVCVSEAAKKSVIQTIGDPGNLCVKYNPLDYTRIHAQAQCLCPEQKPSEQVLFVSVGRLCPPKNYHLLLDVCAELERKYSFGVWIIGDGPQRKELEEKIQEKSIKSVKLLGNQQNPYPFVKTADIFVSSAKWESYGLAVQEALVLGKPVIAVKCPAIEETLDTRFGILVDNNVESLYVAMEKMLLNMELREKYSDNIAQDYQTDILYEKRLRDICSLWE